jgi:hypothetical protein
VRHHRWLLAGRVGTVAAAAGGLAMGAGIAAARLGFESLVQREVPAAARGTAITRAETTFQLAWVAAPSSPSPSPCRPPRPCSPPALACLVAASHLHRRPPAPGRRGCGAVGQHRLEFWS